MKYIRTKDGRIVSIRDDLSENAGLWVVGGKDNILKVANTIEELCDKFVEVNGNNNEYFIDRVFNFLKSCINNEKDKVYGAIWTDKGLIYIAKMNEKGELVLL